jgi:archaellum biogenesis ATPase FlaH
MEKINEKPSICNDFLEKLRRASLKEEDLNVKVDFLIEDFLPRGTIVQFYSKPNQGKSLFSLSVSLSLASKNMRVVYFDFDNSLIALKKRSLTDILSSYQNIYYIHRSKISEMGVSTLREFVTFLKNLAKSEVDLSDFIFVFDSAKNFIVDVNSNKDVSLFFNVMKGLRDRGATVLIPHHTNRAGAFKGASAFLEDADLVYRFRRNSNYFIFFCDKDRIPVPSRIAFEISLDFPNVTIKRAPVTIASLDDEDWEIVEAVRESLTEMPMMKQSELVKAVKEKLPEAGEKKIRKILNSLAGTFWKEEAGQFNSKIYSLLEEESKDIEDVGEDYGFDF